jgi:acyl carrier protein
VSLTVQLGIDSLDILQLMAIMEKRFKLRIPEGELREMDDLGGIIRVVKRHWPAGA